MATSETTNFDEEYEAAEARMTELRNEGHAVAARYDQDRGCVVVTLNTGLELVFPTDAAEGLAGAQTDELSDIEITGAGLGLHWPQLDADLYVPALLQGVFASKRSMAAELGAVGGRVSTPAKVAAARANGRKGGRPPRAGGKKSSSSEKQGYSIQADGVTLQHWADRPEARTKLPVLVRRLIRETTPVIEQLAFPGGDAVDLPGFDGRTFGVAGTAWVPNGDAIWEMGCSEDPAKKARSDFDKRSEEVDEAEQKKLSFVFVTPRRWAGKNAWVSKAKSQASWKSVRAYDASDLEAWLEEAPATRRWLGELLGLVSEGLRTPHEWWSSWSSASRPQISRELVTSRRNGEGERLLEALREGKRVITIAGDDRKEAIAFALATLMQAEADDLLDRTLVLTRLDATLGTRSAVPPILMVDLPEGQEVDLGDRSKIVLVRPYAKGRLPERADIELSYVGSEAFRKCLQEMGLGEEEAERRATETGHSITVLRRRLSDDPEVQRPIWARDDEAQALLPFAFAGSWLDGDRNDDEAALSLLAERPITELHQERDRLLRLEDAPLARYGAVNVVVSQVDALFALGPFIRSQDLDRFFAVIPEVLGERDPALDLPRDEWWMANIKGKARPYSGALISGLGDALCILAVHGQAICGQRLGIDLEIPVSRVVRQLLTDLSEEQWLSRRNILRTLAEAAPATFLDCLEAELRKPQPCIGAIMGSVEGGVSGQCLRVDLLWALESLAWHPEHFGRVAAVTMDLRRFDAKDNWANTTGATAAALFRDWLPSTVVDVDGRLAILRQLSRAYRGPVIDVCLSLLPDQHRFASPSARPRWRIPDTDAPAVTNLDVHRSMVGASHLLLDLAPFSTEELTKVLDALGRLHPDDQTRLVAEVERWSQSAKDGDKVRLRDVARAELGQLAFHKEAGEDTRLLVEKVHAMLEPARPEDRHRWLFKQPYVEWRELTEGEVAERISYEGRERLVHERRAAALAEVEEASGRDGVFAFAMAVEDPRVVAATLVGNETPPEEVAEWVGRALQHPDPGPAKAFLESLLWRMSRRDLPSFVERLNAATIRDDADRLKIAEALPGSAEGWRAVERLGPEAAARYWQTVLIQGLWEDADEIQFAVDQLLSVGRPRSAFYAAHWHPERLAGEHWRRVLEALIRDGEPDGPRPSEHDLTQVLKRLDGDPLVTDEEVARLELPFIRALRPYGDHGSSGRTLALHRVIARSPEDFVAFITWQFRRSDGGNDDPAMDIDDDTKALRAELAYNVLDSWTEMPGIEEGGRINADAFAAWNAEARRLAKEAGRQSIAEHMLGQAYARFVSRRPWESWLPEALADFLDLPDASKLREGFEIGVRNARGVTMRNPYDGGAQERQLADKFRKAADRYSLTHPRLAASIRNLAAAYDREAKREDDQAALGERWHP